MSQFSDTALCQCGCGLPAPLATQSNTKRGHRKGEAQRWRLGHNHKNRRTDGNYLAAHVPGHPNASSSGCVPVHVLVAEKALGRYLPRGAEVHHVDGSRQDNVNRNLVICQDKAYHKLLHVRTKIVRAGGNPNTDKFCRDCGQCKPTDQFNIMRANKSTGLQSICRACAKVRDEAKRRARIRQRIESCRL